MRDRIRELRRAGWSERRIATELNITRHRVRTALEGFQQPTPIRGDTWLEEVEMLFGRARLRKDDPEQLDLGDLAFDVADWLDTHEDASWDARQLGVSLRHIVEGVVGGANPLVRIHARLARKLIARA